MKDPLSSKAVRLDEPVGSAGDRFDRVHLARHIAKILNEVASEPGTVVAVNGPWGSGKSSLKRMIKEFLEVEESNLTFLDLNPWQFESTDQLIRQFFSDLPTALSVGLSRQESWKVRKQMLEYASAVAQIASVGTAATAPILGPMLTTVSKGLKSAGDALKTASGAPTVGRSEGSLQQLKDALFEDLSHIKKPVLVVIDDIDRLEPNEVRLIFRVLKAVADFPNVSYLVLYQRDRVERALFNPSAGESPLDGRRFLEKIVAFRFDLPPVDSRVLEQYINECLGSLLNELGIGESFDWERWARCLRGGVNTYLIHTRQIKRFFAALSFALQRFQIDGEMHADAIDLTLLQLLQYFEPDFYEALQGFRDILAGARFTDLSYKDVYERIPELTATLADSQGRTSIGFLSELFPNVDWIKMSIIDLAITPQRTIKDRRAASQFFYDQYLFLDPRRSAFTRATLRTIIDPDAEDPDLRFTEAFTWPELIEFAELLLETARIQARKLPQRIIDVILVDVHRRPGFIRGELRYVVKFLFESDFFAPGTYEEFWLQIIERYPLHPIAEMLLRDTHAGWIDGGNGFNGKESLYALALKHTLLSGIDLQSRESIHDCFSFLDSLTDALAASSREEKGADILDESTIFDMTEKVRKLIDELAATDSGRQSVGSLLSSSLFQGGGLNSSHFSDLVRGPSLKRCLEAFLWEKRRWWLDERNGHFGIEGFFPGVFSLCIQYTRFLYKLLPSDQRSQNGRTGPWAMPYSHRERAADYYVDESIDLLDRLLIFTLSSDEAPNGFPELSSTSFQELSNFILAEREMFQGALRLIETNVQDFRSALQYIGWSDRIIDLYTNHSGRY